MPTGPCEMVAKVCSGVSDRVQWRVWRLPATLVNVKMLAKLRERYF